MATVRISDLLLRAIIGTNDWERKKKQDLVINIAFDYNSTRASKTDCLAYTVDYRSLTKRITNEVESSQCFLLETLVEFVMQMVMSDPKVKSATVRIDKPHALRFARSVSLELTRKR